MKYFILIVLLFTCFLSWSQEGKHTFGKDTTGIFQKAKQKIQKVSSKLQTATDSVSIPKVDSLKTPSLSIPDSLKGNTSPLDLGKGIQPKLSSLSFADSVKKFKNPFDSLGSKRPSVPGDSLKNAVSQHVENAQQKVSETTGKLQSKTDSIQQKITGKANALGKKTEEKIKKLTGKETDLGLQQDGGKLNTGDVQMPGVEVPGNLQLPKGVNVNAPVVNTDAKLPQAGGTDKSINPALPNMPEVKMPDGIQTITDKIQEVNSKAGEVGEIKEDVKGIKENGIEGVKELPQTEQMKEITSQTEEVKKIKEEAGTYKEQVKDIKNTKIEDINTESLEKEVAKMSDIKKIDDKTQALKEIQASKAAMLQRYTDKKLIQAELKRKTANIANDQIGKFMPAIQTKQADMTKIKKISGSSVQLADSVKKIKRVNAMKGKPFSTRIVPGITIQTLNGNKEALFDVGPQVGYRITGRLTLGVGGIYRFGVGKANKAWIAGKDTYGYRIYSDFTLIKGIFVHAEFESLKTNVTLPTLESSVQKLMGSNFGLGKKYTISRNIKGTLMGLYHVNYSGSIPGQSKFTVRMGFDYVFKKKPKLIL